MPSSYCAPADLYLYGLPRGSFANPGRPAASVSTATSAIALDVHGFELNDPVTFRADAAAGASLPAPLLELVTYYAIPLDGDRFQVSASPNGPSIPLTTTGARVVVIAPLPIASAIEWASLIIEDMLPAHLVPIPAPVHELVRATCAELAAGKLLARTGSASVSLTTTITEAQKRLARWAKGIPLRGENTPTPANLAPAALTASARDSAGWNRYGGTQ